MQKEIEERPIPDPPDGRPSMEQVAWVFQHLCQHLESPGSYRYLIYHRLGFTEKAYKTLYLAGGMTLSNAFHNLDEFRVMAQAKPDDGTSLTDADSDL